MCAKLPQVSFAGECWSRQCVDETTQFVSQSVTVGYESRGVCMCFASSDRGVEMVASVALKGFDLSFSWVSPWLLCLPGSNYSLV